MSEESPALFDVVVPTIGRPSLAGLLDALAGAAGPAPGRVIVVDDRTDARAPLLAREPAVPGRLLVLRGRARGPAAARNVGWRSATADWVAFLDDDVVPDADWLARLAEDLAPLEPRVAASQGRLRVPLPAGRRPTDWERNVAGLATARWATADMAYRRAVLERLGGFDERFPRAYREDADLALRAVDAGYRIAQGRRTAAHPVQPADFWVSVRVQAGNADDVLMRAIHGRGWLARAGGRPGRRGRHLATTAAGAAALAALALGRRRAALLAASAWTAATAELAWARIAPGPRTGAEVTRMLVTSAVLPAAATWHWLRGWASLRAALRSPRVAGEPVAAAAVSGLAAVAGDGAGAAGAGARPRAVLLDRDGTLVVDVPYNGDPSRVVPAPGARAALDRLRAAAIPLAVVSNQSGIARGLLRPADVEAVNRRIEEILGPIGPWFICPHATDDGCACRKPRPGLIVRAAAALGVRPEECAVIGDTAADVEAARAAGARAVLVPTAVTRREEVAAAPEVAADLDGAVSLLLGHGAPANGGPR